MAKQTVNIGTTANDRTGDNLRTAFNKINENFTELYTALGLDEAPLNLGAFEFTGSTITTTDSSAVVIDQATTVSSDLTVGGDILPSVANGGDLGSLSKPFRSLYVSNNTIFIGGTPIAIDGSGNLTVDGSTVSGFDQDLNTTDAVEFLSMTINSNSLFDGAGDTGLNIRSNQTDGNIYLYSYGSDGDGTGAGNIYVKSNAVEIYSDWQNGGAGEKKWTFDYNGDLTFPDDTVQTTAYPGTAAAFKLPIYANPIARDNALPNGVVEQGMMVFLQDTSGSGGSANAQLNIDGTITGWVNIV